jgi:hypothetical protein
MSTPHTTREGWLQEAAKECLILFSEQTKEFPAFRVSCGWPSKSGLSNTNRRIGEAWYGGASADKTGEIFISPVLDDPLKVIGVLIHELVHICVGPRHGHKKPFSSCGREIGLEGKPSQMAPGASLNAWIKEEVLPGLGDYPHAKLTGSGPVKKQSTRLIKVVCSVDGEFNCRITRKWLTETGAPSCACHGEVMVEG